MRSSANADLARDGGLRQQQADDAVGLIDCRRTPRRADRICRRARRLPGQSCRRRPCACRSCLACVPRSSPSYDAEVAHHTTIAHGRDAASRSPLPWHRRSTRQRRPLGIRACRSLSGNSPGHELGLRLGKQRHAPTAPQIRSEIRRRVAARIVFVARAERVQQLVRQHDLIRAARRPDPQTGSRPRSGLCATLWSDRARRVRCGVKHSEHDDVGGRPSDCPTASALLASACASSKSQRRDGDAVDASRGQRAIERLGEILNRNGRGSFTPKRCGLGA